MLVNMLASARQYQEHLIPIWEGLDDSEKGEFAASFKALPDGDVWLTAASRDFSNLMKRSQPIRAKTYWMEHGTGLQGHRRRHLDEMDKATAILVPNDFTQLRLRDEGYAGKIHIAGTPKMDDLVTIHPPGDGTVAVSFHWTGGGRNWFRYEEQLRELAKKYRVLGHGHPRIWTKMINRWISIGIEPVMDFKEIVSRADVYLCDHSSTLFEWAALDRPVGILDRPGGQAMVYSTGLLYDGHGDIGPHLTPHTLITGVNDIFTTSDDYEWYRIASTQELYPYLGGSVGRTISILREEQ